MNKIINEYVFCLGADDPEMGRMIEILGLLGSCYFLAQSGGERVNPRTAYLADNPKGQFSSMLLGGKKLVVIECDITGLVPDIRIDHHNPGDVGFNLGPDSYLEASSLGQLCKLLDLNPSDKDRYLAATDHCFAAAAQGLCPGIDPAKVKKMAISDLYNRFKQTFELYSEMILDSPVVVISNQNIFFLQTDLGVGYSLAYTTVRTIATNLGVPVILRNRQTGPKESLRLHLCGRVTEDVVLTFMSVWGPEIGLSEIYGCEKRGYAGGYLLT